MAKAINEIKEFCEELRTQAGELESEARCIDPSDVCVSSVESVMTDASRTMGGVANELESIASAIEDRLENIDGDSEGNTPEAIVEALKNIPTANVVRLFELILKSGLRKYLVTAVINGLLGQNTSEE